MKDSVRNTTHPSLRWGHRVLATAVVVGTAASIACQAAILKVPGTHATLQLALDAAQPGDVIQAGPGRFDEVLYTKRSGTPDKPIVLDGGNVASIRQLYLRHSHFHLLNTSLSGVTTMYQRLVYFDHGAHFCVVSNNVFDLDQSSRVYGMEWRMPRAKPFGTGEAASDNLIVSNTLKNCRAFILMSIGGDRNLIVGNRLTDSPNIDAFRLFGRSNIIRGNFVHDLPFVEGLGNHPDFIQTFGNNGDGSRGHIIEGNIVMRLAGHQITQLEGNLIPETGDWLFRNNLFVDIALQASCTIPGIRYYNNTFIRCNTGNGGHALNFTSRVYKPESVYANVSGTNYAHGAEVVNNIFVDCGNDFINRGWYAFAANLKGVNADYNYVSKHGYKPVAQDSQRRIVGSSTGWSTFDWWEPNGINGGDPRFQNPAVADYRLHPDSFLADAGRLLGNVPLDHDGVTRPQGNAWSIGAYEPLSNVLSSRPRPVSNVRVVSP